MPSQDVSVELYYDGAWHDIVPDDDVLAGAPITITRGQGDESAAPRPSSVSAQLANDDDMYRTSNPVSPLYGKAGRNTPVRASVDGTVRGTAEASSWQGDQSSDFRQTPRRGSAWVDLQAGGLLQRIGQWTEPLKSPFRQYNEDLTTTLGYWPLEQARGSTSLFSPTPGAVQSVMQNVAFDSQYRPPGSAPLMDVGNDPAEVGAYFAANTSTAVGWQLSWVARYGPLISAEQDIFDWQTTDGTGYGLYLDPSTGEMLIYSVDGAGTPVLAFGSTYGGYDWTQWTMFSVDAQYSAGTTTVWVNWVNADASQSGFITTSFSGVPSTLEWWDTSTFAGTPTDSTIGHVLGTNTSSSGAEDLFGADRIGAWTGYLNETTADRLSRLCGLKNISCSIIGDTANAMPMGPQPVATFQEHLREIATTEDGLIFDDIGDVALVFLLRGARYNQTPALALTPTDLPALPREVSDDLDVHNIVTASQRDGGEYTARDDTGRLGTQDPPDGVGEYRQTVDVNVAVENFWLPQAANWWLRRGTVDRPRFPQVVINLAALDASMISQVEAVDVGSVITISGFREDAIRLHVLGYTEVVGWPSARRIAFTCAPDQQFVTGIYDSTVRRYDSRTSTLNAGYASGATTMVVTFTDLRDAWSETNEPYDWVVAGERITVTSMGAVSGSGPWTQVAAVQRSVNGVAKAQLSGAAVHMHPDQQARYAL